MLENYKKSLKERADLGIPPLPLTAEQTSELVELIKKENNKELLELLINKNFLEFYDLYKKADGKFGLIVTFLAVLELVKDSMIQLVQSDSFGPIHVKVKEKVH